MERPRSSAVAFKRLTETREEDAYIVGLHKKSAKGMSSALFLAKAAANTRSALDAAAAGGSLRTRTRLTLNRLLLLRILRASV